MLLPLSFVVGTDKKQDDALKVPTAGHRKIFKNIKIAEERRSEKKNKTFAYPRQIQKQFMRRWKKFMLRAWKIKWRGRKARRKICFSAINSVFVWLEQNFPPLSLCALNSLVKIVSTGKVREENFRLKCPPLDASNKLPWRNVITSERKSRLHWLGLASS